MILRSEYPPVEVPDRSLPEFVLGEPDAADADRTAIVAAEPGGRGYTYRQLWHLTGRVAAALAERGIGPGDVVALFSGNVPEYPGVLHGVLAAGAAISPVNGLYTPAELAHQLRDCGARLLFTGVAGLDRALAAAAEPGVRVEEVVVLEGPTVTSGPIPVRSFAELLAGTGPVPALTVGPDDLAAVPYSSGTTGLAKGVLLTHRNLAVNIPQMSRLGRVGPNSRLLAVLPLFHIYGLNGIMNHGLHHRARLVTMHRFELTAFLEAIQRHRIDHLYLAPPVALALAKSPLVDDYDLSSVQVVVSAAAPLDAGLADAVAARLDATVLQGYGLTESAPCTHGIPVDRDDVDRASIGLLMPNMEARVVDPVTGRDVAPGTPGELLCRGPNVMLGYLNNPEATAAALDADGFLHTGDLVTVDDGGVFRVVDRLKELIKYKGYQVAPAELEALLLSHSSVVDAAVVGVRDEHGEELPKAFVVLRDEAGSPSAAELIDFVAQRVAPYKKIRQLEFLDRIPKSAAGKILRRDLRARERGSSGGEAAPAVG